MSFDLLWTTPARNAASLTIDQLTICTARGAKMPSEVRRRLKSGQTKLQRGCAGSSQFRAFRPNFRKDPVQRRPINTIWRWPTHAASTAAPFELIARHRLLMTSNFDAERSRCLLEPAFDSICPLYSLERNLVANENSLCTLSAMERRETTANEHWTVKAVDGSNVQRRARDSTLREELRSYGPSTQEGRTEAVLR
jgi:hypothetical protein